MTGEVTTAQYDQLSPSEVLKRIEESNAQVAVPMDVMLDRVSSKASSARFFASFDSLDPEASLSPFVASSLSP